MDYKQENEQIKQRVENLFHQAKRKYGSWVKVAEKLETSYSSVARCRRNLKNYAFPSLPLYFRLCKLVEGQDSKTLLTAFLLIIFRTGQDNIFQNFSLLNVFAYDIILKQNEK